MDSLGELYHELILDHCRHPRCYGSLVNPTHEAHGVNPFCGDDVALALVIDNHQHIKEIQFTGKGCAICMASSSLMCEHLKNHSVSEALELFTLFSSLFHEGASSQNDKLGKTQMLANVKAYPMRVKCVTLPWHTLKAALLKTSNQVSTENG
ncbi:MAG: SUF system NifU family Fe-S cluster assembly protein [Proteobacteria bacterium]|nr:SUF system NifU family Fe-S cluster assembly protein [Pseudomonadota bacterium]